MTATTPTTIEKILMIFFNKVLAEVVLPLVALQPEVSLTSNVVPLQTLLQTSAPDELAVGQAAKAGAALSRGAPMKPSNAVAIIIVVFSFFSILDFPFIYLS
jgi:hypothetical protein